MCNRRGQCPKAHRPGRARELRPNGVERLLGPLLVIDVDDQSVPVSDPALHVMERRSNGSNPSILTVRALKLVGIVVRRSRRDRMQPSSEGRVAVGGMHELEPPLTSQALRGVPEIFDSPLIQVVQFALRGTAPHELRNRIDDQLEIAFASAKRVLCALPVVDIRQQHVPARNGAGAVTKRLPANLTPAVDAIETPDACLEVVWRA